MRYFRRINGFIVTLVTVVMLWFYITYFPKNQISSVVTFDRYSIWEASNNYLEQCVAEHHRPSGRVQLQAHVAGSGGSSGNKRTRGGGAVKKDGE